jgi:uncharacterized protein involved in response to NO
MGYAICRLPSSALCEWPAVAWLRDAAGLHHCSHHRIPFHCRSNLVGPADADRRGACWLRLVVAGWPGHGLFTVSIGVAVPLVRAANRRNYFVIVLLLVLSIASLIFQAGSRGMIALPALLTLQAGVDTVLLLITVIAGRVVPMFSNNGVPGMKATRNPLLEKLAIGTVAALLLADLLQPPPALLAVLAGAAAVVHAARLVLWQPWRTLATPLVWILHVSYGWVVGYLLLRGRVGRGARFAGAAWIDDRRNR